MAEEKAWFSQWFDSEYYHILYHKRNDEEAQVFISELVKKLDLRPNAKIVDVACGKGRHSIYLSSLGYQVLGLDLSANSIQYAKQFESENLCFAIQDMRESYADNQYDLVVNLFTSFGYFDDDEDNLKSLSAMAQALVSGGKLVIDYMNTTKIIQHLRKEFIQVEKGITFHIKKEFSDKFIIKKIDFTDQGIAHSYEEKVRKLYYADFINYFSQLPLKLIKVYGDYALSNFDETQSDRMIFVLQKP